MRKPETRENSIECEVQVIDDRRSDAVRLHSGQYFHFCQSGNLVAELPSGTYRADPGQLLFFPSGILYQLRAVAGTARIITLRLRTRAWAVTTPGDEDAWQGLLGLTKQVYAHGPCLPLAPGTTATVAALLATMAEEYAGARDGYRAQLKASVLSLLVALRRDPRLAPTLTPLAAAGGYQRIREALWEMNEHFDEPLRVGEVARTASLSRAGFQALLQSVTGMTFSRYLAQLRIQKACQLLAETDRPIADIAQACGYRSISQFYTTFRRVAGTAPQRFRRAQ